MRVIKSFEEARSMTIGCGMLVKLSSISRGWVSSGSAFPPQLVGPFQDANGQCVFTSIHNSLAE